LHRALLPLQINAANEQCVTGYGVDRAVNDSGGKELVAARQRLGGCLTGDARTTGSFRHRHTRAIIHAVGPDYRADSMPHPLKEGYVRWRQQQDLLLLAAYRAALREAQVSKAVDN
jgi:O-acetyl-ADP-ribose deacetylase (regulator of RNase III)